MLYQIYEAQRSLMEPFADFAQAAAKLYSNPVSPFGQNPFAQRLASRMSIESLASSALTLAGTTTAISDRLREWRERHGVSYYVVPAGSADVMAPVLAELLG